MLAFLVTLQKPSPNITARVKFTFTHGDEQAGSVTLGLFGQDLPKTVQNFVTIAKSTPTPENKMGYKGTILHRIIPSFMVQGGDFTDFQGTGGYSIYGNKFADESFKIPHRPFCISMANAGPNTNGAQFFITTVDTPWLNGRHVVFGHVLEGQDVISKLEKVPTQRDRPVKPVTIVDVQVEENFEPYSIEF